MPEKEPRVSRRVPRTIRLNLLDHKFGELTVVGYGGKRKGNVLWVCRCSCGQIGKYFAGNLRSGASRRCVACGHKVPRTEPAASGKVHTPEYQAWYLAKSNRALCGEWAASFARFMKDLGPRPSGARLWRKDHSKRHGPENSRWRLPEDAVEDCVEKILAAGVVVPDPEALREHLKSISRQARHQMVERAKQLRQIEEI